MPLAIVKQLCVLSVVALEEHAGRQEHGLRAVVVAQPPRRLAHWRPSSSAQIVRGGGGSSAVQRGVQEEAAVADG